MIPPCARTAPEAVTKSLMYDCATLEYKTLAFKCIKNFRLYSYYCSCNNSNCENPYNKDEGDKEHEDDSISDSEIETENF